MTVKQQTRDGAIRIVSSLLFAVAGTAAAAEQAPPSVDSDGTLHAAPLTIPPSSLWSPEFKAFYAKMALEKLANPVFKVPARDAPEQEWEKLHVWNENEIAGQLATVRARYPADIVDMKIAGVRVGVVTPKSGIAARNEHRVLINLRGGGFIFNQGLSWGLLESMPVASLGRIKVITIDYRQSPHHQYPAATEDVEKVYRELLKQYAPGAIGIYGCSAGGALAGQAAAWFQSKQVPRPGAIGVLCATLGPLRLEGDSRIWGAGIVPANPPAGRPRPWYMETADDNDARAYPAVSDDVLAKFPPTLFLTGGREPAMSPIVATHVRLLRLGVDASLYVMEGAPHAAHVLAAGTPEARDANAYIARFFDLHLSRQ